jgi:hypothetical protein
MRLVGHPQYNGSSADTRMMGSAASRGPGPCTNSDHCKIDTSYFQGKGNANRINNVWRGCSIERGSGDRDEREKKRSMLMQHAQLEDHGRACQGGEWGVRKWATLRCKSGNQSNPNARGPECEHETGTARWK